MSADGQPSPRTLLVQMSAGGLPTCRMLTKDEGQDEEEEVVTGMVTTEAVLLPDDQEGMQFEGTVVEAVEEVEDEEGLDEESMGSGVAMDDGGAALLCKVCARRRCAAGTLFVGSWAATTPPDNEAGRPNFLRRLKSQRGA